MPRNFFKVFLRFLRLPEWVKQTTTRRQCRKSGLRFFEHEYGYGTCCKIKKIPDGAGLIPPLLPAVLLIADTGGQNCIAAILLIKIKFYLINIFLGVDL